MESGRPIKIVRHIVFARPQQLHRNSDGFRDPCRLDHVIIAETAAKAAPDAGKMKLYVGRSQAYRPGDQVKTGLRSLAGGPDFQLAILEVCGAVLRLHRSMSDEGISISSLDYFRSLTQGSFDVSVATK